MLKLRKKVQAGHLVTLIDKNRLSGTDYLSVLYHTGRTLAEDEACDCLYKIVSDVCTEDSIYTQLSRYANVDKDTIIGPILFQNVNLAVYYLTKMDMTDVVRQFEIWNEGVQKAILGSSEYRAVIKADLPDYYMREAMVILAKKYGYLALNDKYKKTDICIDDILVPRDWFTPLPEPVVSPELKESMDVNPAVEKLFEDLNLTLT